MARRAGDLTQRGAASGPGWSNSMPPSTIAAQIVNNHSRAHEQQEPQNNALFGQLLQEFLTDPSVEEPDVRLNLQLVSVVVEAGFNPLLKYNPFGPQVLLHQAKDSISVVRITIERNPALLFYHDQDGADVMFQPPLVAWLLPKLFSLLARPSLEGLHADLTSLLSTFLRVLSVSRESWQNTTLVEIYQASVDAVLTTLQNLNSCLPPNRSPFKLSLPPPNSVRQLVPDGQQLVALPQNCQMEVSSSVQATGIALTLISTICDQLNGVPGTGLAGLTRTVIPDWIADRCHSFWQQVIRLKLLNKSPQDRVENLILSFLTIMKQFVPGAVGARFEGPLNLRMATIFFDELAEVSQQICQLPLSSTVQLELSRILLQTLWGCRQAKSCDSGDWQRMVSFDGLFEELLTPTLQSIAHGESQFKSLQNDLQVAITLCATRGNAPDNVAESSQNSEFPQWLREPRNLEDTGLSDKFSELLLEKSQEDFPDDERPRKRQRLIGTTAKNNQDPYWEKLFRKTAEYFGGNVEASIEGMQDEAAENFTSLSEGDKCEALTAFMRLPCAAVGTLTASVLSNGDLSEMICSVCDGDGGTIPNKHFWNEEGDDMSWRKALETMEKIIESPGLQRSKAPRVLVTAAIHNLLGHISDPEALNLRKSSLGQWCMKSLKSSLRELRIAAGHALPVFLREDVPEHIRQKNRVDALDFMKQVSDRNELGEQETLILAWGQVARVCGDDEINIALLQLVNFLGHTNPMICGVAYNELTSLAEALNCRPVELLKPFWRNIAFEVFKDLFIRPQKAQQLSDLLELTVNQLLLLTQTDTLPYLVLMKKKDVLERIASARGPNITVQDVCMQPKRNLGSILAKLLLHPATDLENVVMDLLCESVPAFAKTDLSSLVKFEPVYIACDMLKAAAAEDGTRKAQIYQAFQTFAVLAERRSGSSSKSSSKANKILASFFDNHILGIMAYFSDVIDNPKDPQPMPERNRCLGAIEEMITIAGNHVSFGLPQIRACLQSAFEIPQLRNKAFSAWSSLLTAVDEEDVEPLIDQTFSIVVQIWPSFGQEVQLKAHAVISDLVQKHSELLRSRIDMLPSLKSIPVLSKIESQISSLKQKSSANQYEAFSKRCQNENATVVAQALKELIPFLGANQQFIHESTVSQHQIPVVMSLCRSILDACTRFTESHPEIPGLAAQCLGLIGCLDPSRAETIRPRREILMLSNFDRSDEAIEFIAFMLESTLIKAFHSATNAKAQSFIAYVMQEMLRFCGFNNEVTTYRPRSSQGSPSYQRWMEIPETVRSTLTPFLNSKYEILRNNALLIPFQKYPIFSPRIGHGKWLRTFVYDLLQRGKGENAQMIFPVLARIIRGYDPAISTFLLPFAVVNIILGGTEQEVEDVSRELLVVLEYDIQGSGPEADNVKQCSDNVFEVLDYMSKWLQEKRRQLTEARALATRAGRETSDLDEVTAISQISSIERVLHSIPAEVISRRAVECGSYSRALFHWEQYVRQQKLNAELSNEEMDQQSLFQHLQYIYTQIDEPDSIEGISAHLQILDPDQQVLEHRKAGRWTAAQSWYELSLAQKPDDTEVQYQLVNCLRESGQYDSLLAHVESFQKSTAECAPKVLSIVAEASWVTGKWQMLEELLAEAPAHLQEFNVGVGKAFLLLRNKDTKGFSSTINDLREGIARGLTTSTTASLQACRDHMLKLHVLYEIETISGNDNTSQSTLEGLSNTLDQRLDILGTYTADKQYLLSLRRAAMQLSLRGFTDLDLASAWITSSRLARKANLTSTAFDAVLHAARLGQDEAKIEHSRLLWKEGHHRKAIQNLGGAINSNAFRSHDQVNEMGPNSMVTNEDQQRLHNKLLSRAHLLRAKWLDQAGQTSSIEIIASYRTAISLYPRWEKGHYYLGKHYTKQLEAELALPLGKRGFRAQNGENAKLIIENYLRSLMYGTKHLYETVPKILTLWLDLGLEVYKDPPVRLSDREEQRLVSSEHLPTVRAKMLHTIHQQLKKYAIERLPSYIFYTALPQMLTRVGHPHQQTYEQLARVIVKVAATYPQQALWSLLAVVKSTAPERSARGSKLLSLLKEYGKRNKSDSSATDLKTQIAQGQRLSEALLHACDAQVEQRVPRISLSKNLGFSHKLAPCSLVVPIEKTLIASLPAGQELLNSALRVHKAFAGNVITISSFSDEVLVLSSLQRPRKLMVRGNDGRNYGLLCKPKDDLRKDQRLMEFNAMINRALLRDVGSSKRLLNIKTYAVTPLNEECGAIEWVEGLKPMRDIIVKLYHEKGISIDYPHTRGLLAEASTDPKNISIFTDRVLKHYRPVLHEWFIETFPEPEAWFTARLKYTRSCAVMSIVGHVLGLGDRHGENVLLVEDDGGVFHVDFNCLFDKGLTFDKPELVPFRLTHNMVDAMGSYGVEGPFRQAAELSLRQVRQNIDTLMTILETFVHDPTADFIGKKKKHIPGVPMTPEEVLEGVRAKARGLFKGETLPLSVEGYVDKLINQATDPHNLAAMYIGWCAFF